MKKLRKELLVSILIAAMSIHLSCEKETLEIEKEEEKENPSKPSNIDLSNWKVTLPIARADGKALEIHPPQILEYATNEQIQPFMYNDADGALVFRTYPTGATTANSSYARTELREQMVAGDDKTNWTFKQGANFKATLAMGEVSKYDTYNDSKYKGEYHPTAVMQIHGRLTDAQRDLINKDDNNAPPVLIVLWYRENIVARVKELKDLSASYAESLEYNSWGTRTYAFPEPVGFEKFTLEVKVTEGRMEVIVNGVSKVYDDIHIERWGVFENYFKAGNYLVTGDPIAKTEVKYYALEVSH
jgi:hypothetical protein